MKRCLIAALSVVFASAPINADAVSPGNSDSYNRGVSLQMSRPAGAVLNPGDEIGFRLQSDIDAYVIVFNIDTEGFVNLLYPARGERPVRVREGETYFIPDENREVLVVEGNTGVEFIFALVVPERDDIDRRELDFLGESNNLPREERFRIDGDPFIAANIIAGDLIRGVSHREGIFLDYQYFYINDRVPYPCYLCGECDGGRGDTDCADYIITANFDETGPSEYPLRRAYEMIEPAAEPVLEEDVARSTAFGEYQSDDGTVNINFYPYNSQVYYETRETFTGARDVDVYVYGADPLWYDPWAVGWYYYPTVSFGFYWGWPSFWWGFNWGYWGGYYCSPYYWPRCYRLYDCYYTQYCYYDGGYRYKPERYKDKWYRGDFDDRRTGYKEKYASTSRGGAYKTAYAQAAKRDGKLRLASGNVKTSRRSAADGKAYAKGSNTSYRTAKRRGEAGTGSTYKTFSKTTRVRNYGRSKSATKYAYGQKKYEPRTRKSYGVKSAGQSARTRTGTSGKTTLKPRTPRTTTYGKPAYRTGRSSQRSSSKSSYQRSRSRTTVPRSRSGSATYKGRPNYKPRSQSVTGKGRSTSRRTKGSAYKPSKQSPRSKSSSSVRSPSRSKPRSSARSSGNRSRSGGKGRR